ncbi:Spc97/Spc98 [Nannochloropsis gaditana]|uniref:Spc97/Spc98 n=1 Tax=Nannochloropsis gaditana TaxID=72520 RepID=W7T449_9STRA|nr:Spc97/Spc98 [Nannochloropsis gaditana]
MGPWGRSGKRRKGKVSGRRLDLMKLEAVLSHQCDSVERTAVAFFLDEGAFLGHIRGLRRLLLGAGCALTSEFVSLLQTRQQEEAALEGPRPADVWPAFEAAVSALGLESDAYLRCFSYRLRRRVDVRAGQRSRGMATGEQGDGEDGSSCTDGEGGEGLGALEDLDADYLPPWPLGTVLPQTTIQTYVRVHELLLRVHWSLQQVQRTRESVRVALKHMGRGEEAKGKRSAPRPSGEQGSVRKEKGVFALRCAHVLLYRLSLVASAFLEHMAAVVDGLGWRALEGALARGVPPLPPPSPTPSPPPTKAWEGPESRGMGREGGRRRQHTA